MAKVSYQTERAAMRERLRSDQRLRDSLKFIYVDTETIISDINRYQMQLRQKYDRLQKKQHDIHKAGLEDASFQESLEWVAENEVRGRMLRLRDKVRHKDKTHPVESFKDVMKEVQKETGTLQRENTRLSVMVPATGAHGLGIFVTDRYKTSEELRKLSEKDKDMKKLQRKSELFHYKPRPDQRPLEALRTANRDIPKFVAVRVGSPLKRAATPATKNLVNDASKGDMEFQVRLVDWRKAKENKKFDMLGVKIGKFLGESEQEIAKRRKTIAFLKQTKLPSMDLRRRRTSFW